MTASKRAAKTASRAGLLHRFAADERGASAIEYGLICGLIFVAVISSIRLVAASYYSNFLQPTAAAISKP